MGLAVRWRGWSYVGVTRFFNLKVNSYALVVP